MNGNGRIAANGCAVNIAARVKGYVAVAGTGAVILTLVTGVKSPLHPLTC
jgi:hypothetical protein